MSFAINMPFIRVQEMLVNSEMRRRSQMFSHPASDAAMNSASQVEIAVDVWSRDRQLMGPPLE